MKTPLFSHLFFATSLLTLAVAPAPAGESKIKFSDTTQPGQLVIQLGMGDVVIRGEDTDEVIVASDEAGPSNVPRDDGLRRLDGSGGYSISETDNVVTLTLANLLGGRSDDSTDVEITVPRSTRIKMERVGPGDVQIHDVAGDLELRGTVGDLKLSGISGGVLVESVNGDVEGEFVALAADRPVSINVVHGDVELHVPTDAKANVRFRTLRGEMLTDFSEDELQTRIEDATADAESGSDQARAPARAARDAARAAADLARTEADRARAQADQVNAEAAAALPHGNRALRVPGNVPMPPMPPMPMAGGKLVVGTLNGGGTELIVTTLTGDITLRKK